MKYILAIDQSTSGTKALLFDESARLIGRSDLPHTQKISENGWVAHDPMGIWENTKGVVRAVVEKTGIDRGEIVGIGISNQRETALVWIEKAACRSMMRLSGSVPAVQRSARDFLNMPR